MSRPTVPGMVIVAVALMASLAAACQDQGPELVLGAAQVTVVTSGADLDPDGYSVRVDSGPAQAVAINGSITLSALAAGDHFIVLDGVAANCTVSDDNPRMVRLSAGATARVEFAVTCGQLTTIAYIGLRDLQFPSCSCRYFASRDLYVMNPDVLGSDRQVPNGMGVADPAWSHDGLRIAFTSGRDGNAEIYVMHPDGTGLTRVTHDTASDYEPTWSPDGRKIAFTSTRQWVTQIYVANVDGSGVALVPGTRGASQPAWSPDGARIAFVSSGGQIQVTSMNDSRVVTLANGSWPAWSPDGTRIAFSNEHLLVMNADGSGLIHLTDFPGGHPTWSPDGTRIAFYAGNSPWYSILTINGDGTDLRGTPSTAQSSIQPAWRP